MMNSERKQSYSEFLLSGLIFDATDFVFVFFK